jgi:putative Holliday junction resolvase
LCESLSPADFETSTQAAPYNRSVSTVPPPHERILALDLGRKRIGLAISDELGFTAQGLDTLERQGRRDDIETLRRLVSGRGITRFLIGDPLHMSGDASRQGDYTREFASELERKTGLPIVFRDERWTSREAERTIRGEGVRNGQRKPTIDKLSAVILLQSYLDEMRLTAMRMERES